MVRRRKIRTLNKDRTVFMYTQYTAIREIKDRTVFMYTQYTNIIRNDGILCRKENHMIWIKLHAFYDFIWRRRYPHI